MKKALLFAALALLFPTVASAQSAFQGKSYEEAMEAGMKFYEQGEINDINYRMAIEAFSYAQQKRPNDPTSLFNLARTNHKMGNCEVALAFYQKYQVQAIATPDYIKDTTSYIDQLAKQCGNKGSLELRCVPEHAKVSIDGEKAVDCNGNHSLKAGTHAYVVHADGFVTEERAVTIVADQVKAETVELQMDASQAALYQRPGITERPLLLTGIIALPVGVVATIAGAGMIGTSVKQSKEATRDGYLYEGAMSADYRSGAMYGGGITFTVIGSAAVITGVTTLIISALQMKKEDEERLNEVKKYKSVAFEPSFNFRPDGAQAGLTVTF